MASSGDRLFTRDAERAYLDLLFPHAAVVTPNLREASVLLGREVVDVDDAVKAAQDLAAMLPGPAGPRLVIPTLDRRSLALLRIGERGIARTADVHDVQHELLLTRCLTIAGGTTQVLLTLAAEQLLGLPREPRHDRSSREPRSDRSTR